METRYLLGEKQIPTHWYNIIPDMPGPLAPVIHPRTLRPVTPQDMLPLFPPALLEQEMSSERWIRIPDEVREVYRLWRPTPLHRARRLEEALRTPAHIYYKYEGVSPAGSHKPNTAVPQAFYNKAAGTVRIATETGAGQWGSSMAMACTMFGLKCTVYMVRVSYAQKPYRKSMMQLWGAEVIASPSDRTGSGRSILAKDARSPGSLGIAISEAVEDAATHDDTKYALGSVLNHVLLHQTVIGQEAKEQMKLAGEYPDVVIGCHGGGSNFAGHDFVPPGIHAGGLRYHGAAPLVSQLVNAKLVEARAAPQLACFEAAVQFARTEGIIPAPESAHAIRGAIDEALRAKEEGRERVVLFNLSGHGHMDMAAYDEYFAGKLEDFEYPSDRVQESLRHLPQVAL